MLCGEGARLWANENALKLCDPDDLLTGKTFHTDSFLNLFCMALLKACFGNVLDDTRALYLDHKSKLDQSLQLERDKDEPPEKKLKYCDSDMVRIAWILGYKIAKSA